MWWDAERHGPAYVDTAIANLEKTLLAVPSELPGLREYGLSAEALAVLDDLPQLEDFAKQYVAFVLLSKESVEPDKGELLESNMRARLDGELRLFALDDGPEFLARGWMPGQPDQNHPPHPLICSWGVRTGIWPDWAVPEYFRSVEATELVLFRPDPDAVLSPEALGVLSSLDQPLRERFDFLWYAGGISPSNAWGMVCTAMQDDLNLRHIPVTSMPSIEDLVSPESRELFASMSERLQSSLLGFTALTILRGAVQPPPERGPMVYAYGSSPDEFLVALGLWLDAEISKAAKSSARRSSTTVQPTRATTSFEGSLQDNGLAKFNNLPPEFRNALEHEATVLSYEVALRYLRDLPDDVLPVVELVSEEMMPAYERLAVEEQGTALLSGYLYALDNERHIWGEYDPAGSINSVLEHFELVREREGIPLPLMEVTLSADALAKYRSLDPLLQRAFTLIWESQLQREPIVPIQVERMEANLLAAPRVIPSYESIGLTSEQIDLMIRTPNAEQYVRELIAGLLMLKGGWDPKREDQLAHLIDPLSTADGQELFARGVHPSEPQWSLLCCSPTEQGLWPEWLLPEMLKGVPPQHLVVRWPDPEEMLSSEAIAKMQSLGPKMLSTLKFYWYGSGPLPLEVADLVRQGKNLEQQLISLWILEFPPIETLVTEEGLAAYDSLSEHYKEVVDRSIASSILWGRIGIPATISEGVFTSSKSAMVHDSTHEEFMAVLREYADWEAKQWAIHAR